MATWRDTLFGEGHTRPPLTIKEMMDPTRRPPPSSPLGVFLKIMTPTTVATGTLTGEERIDYPPTAETRAAGFDPWGDTETTRTRTGEQTYIQSAGLFENFISMELKRDRKAMTASGTVVLSWPGAELFNQKNPPAQKAVDGARAEIWLDGQKAATIRIDSRTSHGDPQTFRLELSFRGLSSALVDSSAKSGQMNKMKPGVIVDVLAKGFESKVIDETRNRALPAPPVPPAGPASRMEEEDLEWAMEDDGGDEQPTLERFIVQEGETTERAMRRAAREHGYLLEEDEDGNLRMKRKDSNEGTGQPFVLGKDFTEWSVKRDMAPRFSKVTAKGNAVPTDQNYGRTAEQIAGEAIDLDVKYKRELKILVDSDHSAESLKKRAVTEANRRKGQGLDVTLTMSHWSDSEGRLWKPGRLHHVTIPVDQIDTLLQISNVLFRLAGDKREAQLTLVSPETFNDKAKPKATEKGIDVFGASVDARVKTQTPRIKSVEG